MNNDSSDSDYSDEGEEEETFKIPANRKISIASTGKMLPDER